MTTETAFTAWLARCEPVIRASFNPEGLKDPGWATLLDGIDQEVLDKCAHPGDYGCPYEEAMQAAFGDEMPMARPAKRLERYNVKKDAAVQPEATPDRPFKCVSDFVGYRVHETNVTLLREKALALVDEILEKGGMAFSISYGPSYSERVYAWFPGQAIAEISIQPPFVSWVFSCDSAIRDQADGLPVTDPSKLVDYSANGVWKRARTALLAGDNAAAAAIIREAGLPKAELLE